MAQKEEIVVKRDACHALSVAGAGFTLMNVLLLDELLDGLLEVVKFRELLRVPLGVDLLPVDRDLEGATFSRDQLDAVRPLTKGL